MVSFVLEREVFILVAPGLVTSGLHEAITGEHHAAYDPRRVLRGVVQQHGFPGAGTLGISRIPIIWAAAGVGVTPIAMVAALYFHASARLQDARSPSPA